MATFRKFVLIAALLASSQALAVKVETGTSDVTLNVNLQLQARYEGDWGGNPPANAAPNLASPSGHYNNDFFIRRARLITSGEAYKYFTYYMMLDTPRFGYRGDYTVTTFIQDLFVGYKPVQDVNIEAGLLYLPLSHGSLASNSQTNALEGPSDILKYPLNKGLRMTGVQLRGLFAEKRILIRGGIFEGARTVTNPTTSATGTPPVNPNGTPMVGGVVRFNLVGDEPGYSMPSIYLDGKTRVSVGVGAHYQPRGGGQMTGRVGTGNFNAYEDYKAFAADFFADLALPGDTELAFLAELYRFDWGTNQANSGNGAHGELGYRFGPIEPQVNFVWFNSDPKTSSLFRIAGGLNYYFHGHNAKLQLEVASQDNARNTFRNLTADNLPASKYVVLQAQAAF